MFSRASKHQVILNTLSNLTIVEVVSAPQVLVINNHQRLSGGDRVPDRDCARRKHDHFTHRSSTASSTKNPV